MVTFADLYHHQRHLKRGILCFLVDDFSRIMWVYFLSTKDEAFETFKKFKTLVENGFEKRSRLFVRTEGVNFVRHNSRVIVRMLEFLDIILLLIPNSKMAWWNGGIELLWQWQEIF